MSERGDSEWISDRQEAIRRVEYTHGITYRGFLEDRKTQDAVLRNIAILGEAAKNLSAEFKRRHKGIEWKAIAGMRDKLVLWRQLGHPLGCGPDKASGLGSQTQSSAQAVNTYTT